MDTLGGHEFRDCKPEELLSLTRCRNSAAKLNDVIAFLSSADGLATPEVTAIDIRKCLLCHQDHLNHPVHPYEFPHPSYTIWYTCPIADAPVGLYFEGDETLAVDTFVRERINDAMRCGRWFVLVSHTLGTGIQSHQKNVEFPRDRIISKKLMQAAQQIGLLDDPAAGEYALDWIVSQMTRQLLPPQKMQLRTAEIPKGGLLLEDKTCD